ncbi:uncharacterized protein LOC106156471 [Lingula anatina]|uniref:Uncharacterized protein LOC106156471 n=1 Tax=Lingula anatina TaxID=7574 RepID=A0A1S3HME0_LINAN|nr:uncharacterized protein LOC106156471 [Lingula anatina]|eukprot:XP_013387187.1 uncharacterized protein LOC106156471 [Lingula anatina]
MKIYSIGLILTIAMVVNRVVSQNFVNLGCWGDKPNRAVPTLEGKDPILDGPYWKRENPIEKCYQAAKKRGYQYFAIQHGGWCASSSDAGQTYKKYGASNRCQPDGEGGPWSNQVYKISDGSGNQEEGAKNYVKLGCWADRPYRAVPSLEGQDPTLDGLYWKRENPIEKCYQAAKRRGYQYFAIQHGGWCASSCDAGQTYKKYGASTRCQSDGEGGPWANQVYQIPDGSGNQEEGAKSYKKLGCWADKPERAIPTLEGQDPILDGAYETRENPIEKCYQAAKKRGYEYFAIQHGGWCASSRDAKKTYKKYGASTNCQSDGEGGPWANQVYKITKDKQAS